MAVLQCSFSVCLRNREESYKAVERYVDEWRAKKQTPFRCYYDTMSLDTVIVEKMYSTADVVHRSASVARFPVRYAPQPIQAQIPLRRLPRNFPGRGSFGEVGIVEFGLHTRQHAVSAYRIRDIVIAVVMAMPLKQNTHHRRDSTR